MGCTPGPTLADYFLGSIKEKILKDSKIVHPVFYGRYVNDVFPIFEDEASFQNFQKILNSQHKQLKIYFRKSNRFSKFPGRQN